jgi:hypothetical protein
LLPNGDYALATLKAEVKVTWATSPLTQVFGAEGYQAVGTTYTQPYRYSPAVTVSGKPVSVSPVTDIHVSQTVFPVPETELSVSTRARIGGKELEFEYSVTFSVEPLPRQPRIPLPALTKSTAPWLVTAVLVALTAAAASHGRPVSP